MPEDRETLEFYAREAEAYGQWSKDHQNPRLETFLSNLPPGARVLELGCGYGRDSATMLAHGFDVVATDASPEMAAQASRHLGRTVSVLPAGDLAALAEFDAIWANACLLHIPMQELADVIARIYTALKSQGCFYASYKGGEGEGRDRFGRYYNYPSVAVLEAIYHTVPWSSLEISQGIGGGYDREKTTWLHVTAVRR
ncbi:Methyltransferase type 12 [Rhizobium sp. PDO1-076]|uniref:class I SAM-dependent methyltransferase n=1 Tax=Rhizobium sp. PDO1-076 TaxID=1125979 RepID=UPI00024E3DDD|nr:class I SAM-dependent methyltransferase [Rhizobium sp. PDO1-076]EHS53833.1 Methyltransferase type 12 [Rhizobium sp. PDO1-076]